MILVWENTSIFKKHLEEMESFRRTHQHFTPLQQIKMCQATQIPASSTPCLTKNSFNDDKGKSIVIPIWEMSLPKGAQN